MDIQWREPTELAAGDSLIFKRSLDQFPAPDWSLTYELRGQAPIEFNSVADGADHSISVDPATTAAWLPGDYQFSGYAILASTGERHQIYLATLTITPNTPQQAGNEDTRTFAQKMVDQIEAVLISKAKGDLVESSVGESRFRYLTMEELRTEHAYWKSVRRNEIKKEMAKAGRPTGNRIRPLFNITGTGPVMGSAVWPFGGSGTW